MVLSTRTNNPNLTGGEAVHFEIIVILIRRPHGSITRESRRD